MYAIRSEPRGDAYLRLVDFARDRGGLALLVVRPGIPLSQGGKALLDELEPYLVTRRAASEWPGTRLLDEEATLTFYRLEPESVALLKRAAARLYAWEQPDLPEDLCFLDREERPWLANICHEEAAYLFLTEWEMRRLLHAVPQLKGALEWEEDPEG